MAGFVFKKDENAVASAGAGGALNSGVHKVTIKEAYYATDAKGNHRIDLVLESETKAKATIFGMCMTATWEGGSKNYDYDKFQEFIECANPAFTGVTANVQRKDFNGVETPAEAFTELVGKVLVVAIQVELDAHNNKEKKIRNIQNSFLASGLSIAEKKAGSTVPASKTLTIKDYSNKRHQAWIKGGASADTSTAGSADTGASAEDDEIDLD